MQVDSPSGIVALGDRASPGLKRPYARAAHAFASPEPDSSPPPRRGKAPKLERSPSSPERMPPPSSKRGASSSRGSRAVPSSGSSSSRRDSHRGGSGRRGGGKKATTSLQSFDEPLHNLNHIEGQRKRPLKPVHAENPKSPLSNFCTLVLGVNPEYKAEEGLVGDTRVWRVTVSIEYQQQTIVGCGDSPIKKDAEKFAALHAVILLNNMGVLENTGKSNQARSSGPSGSSAAGTTKALSDGTLIDYEKARQFMDYYCRRFGFGREDISWEDAGAGRRGHSNTWEAVMTVGGRRIGIGTGPNKKQALIHCYLDVTHYLESCDPDLWKTFMAAAKTGKDLGMAPKVHFHMSDRLDDDVRDLCHDIKQSTIYKNRPSKTASSAISQPSSSSHRPRLPASTQYLVDKSTRLADRRKHFNEDPTMERMRTTRASLPVFTRAADVIRHIDENEVTICMAATGSGKTTQIPQLVLDDWIAKGKGAQCNIVCTQPRRLAAISVADRVAKERGETVGHGSVGYSVRFESKPPEEHGSITFCTIGVFLKRMQSALLEGSSSGGQNLDDVTHVIVDEVHERDVDTDLLLVVLKRLLADRKAKGKPIKVVLMSATIDPTLFQRYFPDERNEPAKVIDIPGRSFPVEKHFLDSYISALSSVPASRGVFMDKDVTKYLQAELDFDALRAIGIPPPPAETSSRDDDSTVPPPLIALTIAHVLKRTDSGHVLVFLPGWDDIAKVNRALLESAGALGHNFADSSKFSIHFLHSSIPLAEQQVIFEPPKEGVRRIILATNIAETSVTIPDVVYVVDSGKVKEQRYDPDRHMSSLVSAWIGSSNLNQRAGRAGRHRPGEYFGVLTKKRADSLHPYQMVEMKRVDLSNVVMHVKALNFPGIAVEDVLAATIEPPSEQRVAAAMDSLKMVGALDAQKNLTPLGRVLLQLPVDVNMGRMVLFGSFFRCLDHALTLAALLTSRDPFVSPMHLKNESAAKKNFWTPTDFRSDALAAMQAYNAWWALQSRGEYHRANAFCSENFLAKPTLLMIPKVKSHLLQALRQAGVLDVSGGGGGGSYVPPGRRRDRDDVVPPELNANADSMPLVTALIAIASQPNFAIRTGNTYRTQKDKTVFIHPSSVNHRKRDDESTLEEKQIMIFAEKRQNVSSGQQNAQKFILTTTRLDPVSYILFGAYDIIVTERGLECDEWLPIVGNIDALDDIQRLKYLMEACMLRVFEGITFQRHRQRAQRDLIPLARDQEKEEESDDDDDATNKDYSLTSKEIRELDLMTRDIVRILNNYSDERIASQSRHNSRPGTPSSPTLGSSRLSGGRSGTSTPFGGLSAFNSRPGTPGPSPLRKW